MLQEKIQQVESLPAEFFAELFDELGQSEAELVAVLGQERVTEHKARMLMAGWLPADWPEDDFNQWVDDMEEWQASVAMGFSMS